MTAIMSRVLLCAWTVAVALGLAACRAVPDEDTMAELRSSVAALPSEVQAAIDKWAANRIAFGYLLNYDSDELVGTVTCGKTEIGVSVHQVLRCLSKYNTAQYKDCLGLVLDDIHDEHLDDECNWTSFERRFDPKYTPSEFEAERIGFDERVRALLGEPPPLEVQLALAAAGLFGPAGVLCLQGLNWGCPDTPGGAPGQTPGDDPRGDFP